MAEKRKPHTHNIFDHSNSKKQKKNHDAEAVQRPAAEQHHPPNANSHLSRSALPTVPAYSARNQPSQSPHSDTLSPLPPIATAALEEQVFTHQSSLGADWDAQYSRSYETLEFLGDAYLELIATRLICARFSKMRVGQRAALRESMINNHTLAGYATRYGFRERLVGRNPKIHFDGSAARTDPWIKVLADVFEAYVAAVIQADPEGGFAVVEAWLAGLWEPVLRAKEGEMGAEKLDKGEGVVGGGANVVDVLNKAVFLHPHARVEYLETRPAQQGGHTMYWLGAYFTGWGHQKVLLGEGKAQNKRDARMAAAAAALREKAGFIEELKLKKAEAYKQKMEEKGQEK